MSGPEGQVQCSVCKSPLVTKIDRSFGIWNVEELEPISALFGPRLSKSAIARHRTNGHVRQADVPDATMEDVIEILFQRWWKDKKRTNYVPTDQDMRKYLEVLARVQGKRSQDPRAKNRELAKLFGGLASGEPVATEGQD